MLFANKSSEQAGSSEGKGCFPVPEGRSRYREYKSDVFSMLMENKTYALEVYNAAHSAEAPTGRSWG